LHIVMEGSRDNISERLFESDVWQSFERVHNKKIRRHTEAFRQRRGIAKSHPIYDFLFTYYSFSPAKLERWHPGYGTGLVLDSSVYSDWFRASSDYYLEGGVAKLKEEVVKRSHGRLVRIARLCEVVASRPARFSCYGLHEWAMLYQTKEKRHDIPLRMSYDDIATVVEKVGLRCSHYDAYRFFTEAAKPKNRVVLLKDNKLDHEQRGCIHLNMDLYKWTYLLYPLLNSAILLKAFELAVSARELDMRASPYDLIAYGFTPIFIETDEGREEYQRLQIELSERADAVRRTLYTAVKCLFVS
jgi:hypothetical protein